MRSIRRQFRVDSPTPPVIEFDHSARSVYVRFLRRAVKKTVERYGEGLIVTVDLDRNGEVIGVEGIGVDNFSIWGLLKKANVQAENIDFSKARMRATPRAVSRELVPT